MVQPHSAKWESKALILISEKSPPHSTFSLQGCPGVRTRVHLPLRSRSCPRPVKHEDPFWCGSWSYAGFKARLPCRMKGISRCGPRQWVVLEQAGSIGEVTPSSFVVVQSPRGVQLFVTWTPALQPPCPHHLPEFAQTHVHQVCDASQPFHLLSSPPPDFNLSQHQGLFQWVDSSYQMAKVLELQLQHQPFQWLFRVNFL